MRIELVDGWQETAKVACLAGMLSLGAIVANSIFFTTPWSTGQAALGTAAKQAVVVQKMCCAGSVNKKREMSGPSDKEAGAPQKAGSSVGGVTKAEDMPTPKPIAHPEVQVKETPKNEGEPKAPASPISARGSWSSVIHAD